MIINLKCLECILLKRPFAERHALSILCKDAYQMLTTNPRMYRDADFTVHSKSQVPGIACFLAKRQHTLEIVRFLITSRDVMDALDGMLCAVGHTIKCLLLVAPDGMCIPPMASLHSCRHLRILEIFSNPVVVGTFLPQTLKELHLTGRKWRGFNTFKLPLTDKVQLTHLTMRNCNLRYFPEGLSTQTLLERLSLDGTGVQDYTLPVGVLRSLRSLSLRRCNCLCIPADFSGLTNLTCLEAGRNSLTEENTIATLNTLPGLKRLDIAHNMLSSVTHLTSLTALTYLNICCNPPLTLEWDPLAVFPMLHTLVSSSDIECGRRVPTMHIHPPCPGYRDFDM